MHYINIVVEDVYRVAVRKKNVCKMDDSQIGETIGTISLYLAGMVSFIYIIDVV